jgi:hypothetical protein
MYPNVNARTPKRTTRNENIPKVVTNKITIKPIHPKAFVSISKIEKSNKRLLEKIR